MKQAPFKLAVVGSGAWGTTLAMTALRAGTDTTLVVRNDDVYTGLLDRRAHPHSLRGIGIPRDLNLTQDVQAAITAADVVLLVVPTQKLRAATAPIAAALGGKIVVTASKGIEVGTSMLPIQILEDALGNIAETPICALSGPNLAVEIAQGKPGTTVIASKDLDAAAIVQALLVGESFRVYTNHDTVGVQMGGALKNIIAIGAGIGDGLNAGDNAKAAFMTRGIAEIARLGVSLGADPLTFAGLSGIGDLICTCSSNLSRNHQVGVGLAAGKSLEAVLAGMTEVAEGVDTTRAAVDMARTAGVEMPIAQQMYEVLFEGKSPVDAVRSLMVREPRHEHI
jgi:glycerol-3-phosphate dehydrogenase (NAD(P)+)